MISVGLDAGSWKIRQIVHHRLHGIFVGSYSTHSFPTVCLVLFVDMMRFYVPSDDSMGQDPGLDFEVSKFSI